MHFKPDPAALDPEKSFPEPLKSQQINNQSEDLLWEGKFSELSLVGLVWVYSRVWRIGCSPFKAQNKTSFEKKKRERKNEKKKEEERLMKESGEEI